MKYLVFCKCRQNVKSNAKLRKNTLTLLIFDRFFAIFVLFLLKFKDFLLLLPPNIVTCAMHVQRKKVRIHSQENIKTNYKNNNK